jgi:hypothetical protein
VDFGCFTRRVRHLFSPRSTTPGYTSYTSLGVADIGPRHGKPDVFPQANLLAGVSF